MAARARGRISSHGIDGAILETSVGSAGKVLEADMREGARRGSGTLHLTQALSNRGRRGRERLGEAAGGPGIDSKLCARCRATSLADRYAQEVPVKVRSSAALQNQLESLLEEAHITLSSSHKA
jgi:hypothetical protein